LNCFINLVKGDNVYNYFTGERTKADTTYVMVDIDAIRNANIKLTERLNLLELVKLQETQLNNYKSLIDYKDNTIEYYKSNLHNTIDANIKLNKDINKEINKKNIWKYTTFGIFSISVISILIISLK